jgi:hypothetical protein
VIRAFGRKMREDEALIEHVRSAQNILVEKYERKKVLGWP